MEIFLSLGYTVKKHFSFLLEPLTDELIPMSVENPVHYIQLKLGAFKQTYLLKIK